MAENKDDQAEIVSFDSNKKRKLQEEHLGMPSPKHKFRDRSCCAEHESPITHDKEADNNLHKYLNDQKTDDFAGEKNEGCESVEDSNSFIEESDTAMSMDTEAKPDTYCGINYIYWPPNSSGSSSVKNYEDNYYSPNNLPNKSGERSFHFVREDLGDDANVERQQPKVDTVDELGGNCAEICSEFKYDDQERCLDVPEDLMLYSNDMSSNMYVLSSGRWDVNPDARLSARKPTIDQEFEQYFSMLML